jgi:hypothetical protein
VHSVFGESEVAFQIEFLLEPFKEQLDLPALFIKRGDLCCGGKKSLVTRISGVS